MDFSTDYRSIVEYSEIIVSIRRAGAVTAESLPPLPADPRWDTEAFSRIAQFNGLSPGSHLVEIQLRDNRRIVAERRYQFVSNGGYILQARIDRSCEGIQCPPDDNPNATECQDGECVPPTCLTPEECGLIECMSAEDCAPSRVPCQTPACVLGSCRFVDTVGACAEDEYCDDMLGCRPRNVPLPGNCGQPCDFPGGDCEAGIYDCATGMPVCVSAGPMPSGTSCRPANGDCDAEDRCNGTGLACPDEKLTTATICRPSQGECDEAEVCDGVNNACPMDGFQPIGTSCSAGFCDQNGMCSGTCTPNANCTPEGQPCRTGRVDCTSGTPNCVANGNAADGTMCGETNVGAWGSCGGFSNTCDESGTRSRTVTSYTCQAGSCQGASQSEPGACSRNSTGVSCNTSCNTTGSCQSASCAPPAESCNGSDDNCNGQCDEGCRVRIIGYWSNSTSRHYYGRAGESPPDSSYQAERDFYIYQSELGRWTFALRRCNVGGYWRLETGSCSEGVDEGILGYAGDGFYSTLQCRGTDVSLLGARAPRGGSNYNYFYTTSQGEMNTATTNGYTAITVRASAWTAPS